MSESGYLLTATALLIAVFSFRAQLWFSFTRVRKDECWKNDEDKKDERSRKVFGSFGLFWIYIAIAIAMIAFGFLLAGEFFGIGCPDSHACRIAKGLVIASLWMGLAEIVESAFSVFLKAWRDKTASDVLFHEEKVRVCWLISGVVCAILLAAFSVTAVYQHSLLFIMGFLSLAYLCKIRASKSMQQ